MSNEFDEEDEPPNIRKDKPECIRGDQDDLRQLGRVAFICDGTVWEYPLCMKHILKLEKWLKERPGILHGGLRTEDFGAVGLDKLRYSVCIETISPNAHLAFAFGVSRAAHDTALAWARGKFKVLPEMAEKPSNQKGMEAFFG